MKCAVQFSWFFALTGRLSSVAVAECGTVAQKLDTELAPLLSSSGLITQVVPPRWSSFDAPAPGAVVNVETELDVALTVCNISPHPHPVYKPVLTVPRNA
jgi:hypothetical protein